MADDCKRTHVICTKLNDRMALDLLHAAAAEDRSISEYLYLLIRRDLYGRSLRPAPTDGQSTDVYKVDQ